MTDWPVILLGGCLLASITATVVVIVLDGKDQLIGTGLGGLTVLLAGALAARVKTNGSKKT